MADLTISVDIDARKTKAGATEARSEIRGIVNEAEKAEGRFRSLARIDLSAIGRRLKEVGAQIRDIGSQLMSAGQSLTIGVTAPLTALATLGVKSALEMDKARTKILALVGDSEAAAKKIAELNTLADRSVGVTRAGARETYAQLKGIGDIAEDVIDRMIVSMGKLNAAFSIDDQAGFMRNLVQIFSQGFEIPDIKEAIGRVPIFRQLLEQAFGTDDPAVLKTLKESGKLTLDTWLSSLSDAINADPRIANIQENLSTKLAKGWERLNESLAPIGQIILDVVVPALEKVVPYIERLARWFQNLSPEVQTAVIAIGAFVAAIGPALVILGAVVGAIGTLISAFGAIIGSASAVAIGVGAVLGLMIQVGPVLAIVAAEVYLLYQAWESNFGGIRDLTAIVAAAVSNAWTTAVTEIKDLTNTVLAEVSKIWAENGDEIMAAVASASDAIKATWSEVVRFWQENNEAIRAIAAALWDATKAVIVTAIRLIGNAIKLGLSIINGDWKQAWEATIGILNAVQQAWLAILSGVGVAAANALRAGLQAVWALRSWIEQQAFQLGKDLIQGLINGLISGKGALATAARGIIAAPISIFRDIAKTQSPSKVTQEIGKDVALGLAVGLHDGIHAVEKASAEVGNGVIDQIRQLFGGDFEGFLQRTFDVLLDSGRSFGDKMKTIFGGLLSNFKRMLSDMLTAWISSKLFGGASSVGGGGGGGLFGVGPGGTPYFNPNAAGIGGGGVNLDGINVGTGGFDPRTGTYSNPTGRGGLSSGAAAGIAVGANIIGGAIGGTAGNIISLAGTGAGLGFMLGAKIGAIGGPIGMAIGAGIGALAGVLIRIFGGDPKRKRDKNEKIPQLNRGFTDAMAELRQLVADVRTLRVSPDSAIARATELRNSIASGFGIQFESNKYRKEAQSLIAARLKEADRLIADLRQAAEVANAASERERRIIPEFASGVMMSRDFMRQYSDFKARNGMLAGVFTGRDSLPSMLAPGEMVLNPGQQSRVRSNAGMDPFVNAGIPGYAGGRGASDEGRGQVQQEMVFIFEHSIDAEGMVSTTLKNSPAVGRELKIRIEDQFRNNELGLRKRGV